MTHRDARSTLFKPDATPVVEWSVGDLLQRIQNEVPDRPALIAPGSTDGTQGARTWTYAAVFEEARRVAAFLLARFRPGDHIGVWASNRPEWLFVQFGVSLAGMTLVAVNPASRPGELSHALRSARVVGLFYNRRYRDIDGDAQLAAIADDVPDLRLTLAFEDWARLLGSGDTDATPPIVDPSSPAMIQFTSGTTGRPKGAVLSHRGLVNVARFSEQRFALRAGSVWLNWLPLFHTGGCVWAVMMCMWNRGTLILLPGFDAGQVLRCVETYRARWLPSVQTATMAMLEHPEFASTDLSSLEVITQGGAPVPPDLVRRMERSFGAEYVMVFGQTETSSCITLSVRGDTDEHKSHTVGLPLPHTEVRIVDPVTREVVPCGEPGEICVRGYATMTAYFDQAQETAAALSADGWLSTGDLGTLRSDGYLTITGRIKDVVIRGGENIYPREIEDALSEYPGVATVAAFGVPDPVWGEQLVAAIRMTAPAIDDEPRIRTFLLGRLARHKIPAVLWFVETLPETNSGKVQKFALRELYLATEGRRDTTPARAPHPTRLGANG